MSDRYGVVVTRERDAWLADVPSIDGAHTWARDLSKLDGYVREAIALALDLPEGAEASLFLDYEFRTGDADVDAEAAALRAARAEYDRLGRDIGERTKTMASRLAKAGWSVRDIAGLVGVSFQRVSQIAGGATARSAASGRFVTKAAAVRNPSKTVAERTGGKFVTTDKSKKATVVSPRKGVRAE